MPLLSTTYYILSNILLSRKYGRTVHQLFADFKKAYVSIKREALCSILIEFGITMKLGGVV
jgi:hypothetical protein